MTDKALTEIKKSALAKALLDQAGNALRRAKRSVEEADKDSFKNFQAKIEEARKDLEEAEQLWRETYKL